MSVAEPCCVSLCCASLPICCLSAPPCTPNTRSSRAELSQVGARAPSEAKAEALCWIWDLSCDTDGEKAIVSLQGGTESISQFKCLSTNGSNRHRCESLETAMSSAACHCRKKPAWSSCDQAKDYCLAWAQNAHWLNFPSLSWSSLGNGTFAEKK